MAPAHERAAASGDEIRNLTALRFFAALWVFIFHVHARWPLEGIEKGSAIGNVLDQGFRGVSLFFVLSGFILALTYANRIGPNFRSAVTQRYFVKRLARVYPIYLWGFVLSLPWLMRIGSALGWSHAFVLGLLNITGLNAWVPGVAMDWYGNGGWSISDELFFYLCFPFAISRLATHSSSRLIAVAATMSLLAGALVMLTPLGFPYTVGYAFPPVRLPEFLLGVCAGLLARRQASTWTSTAWPVSLVASLFVLSVNWGASAAADVLRTVVALAGFALLISGLTYRPLKTLDGPVLNALGQASYSFYITQIPLLFLAGSMDKRFGLSVYMSGWSISACLLALNLCVSLASWKFIEIPLRGRIMKAWEKRTDGTVASAQA